MNQNISNEKNIAYRVRVSTEMYDKLLKITEAMKIDLSTSVRILLVFTKRFSTPHDFHEVPRTTPKNHYSVQYPAMLNVVLPQEILNWFDEVVEAEQSKRAIVFRMFVQWAMNNIGNYTIEEWIND